MQAIVFSTKVDQWQHDLTLAMLRLCKGPKHKEGKIYENHLIPVMLVVIEKLALSSHRWVSVIFEVFCIIMYWPN